MIRHTISLPETMSQNISSLLDDGSYGGMSDYVRDLVRKDMERALNLAYEHLLRS